MGLAYCGFRVLIARLSRMVLSVRLSHMLFDIVKKRFARFVANGLFWIGLLEKSGTNIDGCLRNRMHPPGCTYLLLQIYVG